MTSVNSVSGGKTSAYKDGFEAANAINDRIKC